MDGAFPLITVGDCWKWVTEFHLESISNSGEWGGGLWGLQDCCFIWLCSRLAHSNNGSNKDENV